MKVLTATALTIATLITGATSAMANPIRDAVTTTTFPSNPGAEVKSEFYNNVRPGSVSPVDVHYRVLVPAHAQQGKGLGLGNSTVDDRQPLIYPERSQQATQLLASIVNTGTGSVGRANCDNLAPSTYDPNTGLCHMN